MKYELCQKLCGLYSTKGACFQYGIKECRGACIQDESPDQYNQRAELAIKNLEYKYQNFLIIDKGRHTDERSIVSIQNGSFMGFGYAETEYTGSNMELLKDCIKKYPDNRDIQIIIKGYINRNAVEKIIPLNDESL